MREATAPSTGSMTTSTTITVTNIPTLATVIGSIAKISRTWERSEEARDMSCPVGVSSWKLNPSRCMCTNIRLRRSASAR